MLKMLNADSVSAERVIEALGTAGYYPEKDDEIGMVRTNKFRRREKSIRTRIDIWLTNDSFRDAPRARLADVISWFRLEFVSSWKMGSASIVFCFRMIGLPRRCGRS